MGWDGLRIEGHSDEEALSLDSVSSLSASPLSICTGGTVSIIFLFVDAVRAASRYRSPPLLPSGVCPPHCRFALSRPSRSSSSVDAARAASRFWSSPLLPLDLSTPQPLRPSPSPIFGHPSSSHFQSISTPLLPANLSMPQLPDLCLPLLPFSILCFSPKIPVRRSPSLPPKSLFVDLPPFPQNPSPSLSITLAHFIRYVVNHCLHLSRSLSPPACRPRLLELLAWIGRTARPRLLELSAWIGKTARPRLVALACSNCRPRLARAVCLD